jgi:hypothetical protein
MKYMEEFLTARDIPFDAQDNRIMCFPHIINICSQHVINLFTDPTLFDSAEDPTDDDLEGFLYLPDDTTPVNGSHDVIALVRHFVRFIRASGMRRDEFQDIIAEGNKNGWGSTAPKPPLPAVQLLHDVKTRWDSVYYMVKRFLTLRPVSHFIEFFHRNLLTFIARLSKNVTSCILVIFGISSLRSLSGTC